MLCYHPVIIGQSSHCLNKRLLDKYEATVCLNVVANNVAAQRIYLVRGKCKDPSL